MTESISVLLVDDDESFGSVLSDELRRSNHQVHLSKSAEEAHAVLLERAFDVVLLDLQLPGMDGLAALQMIKEIRPSTEVIVLTGYGSVDSAVEAMRAGAHDFLAKPCPLNQIETVIQKASEKRKILQENKALKQEVGRSRRFDGVIGESAAMRAVLDMISKVAPTDSTVLIGGESGVGKEVVAKAIHKNSNRQEKPFIVVDCGSLHENLLLSELFGHEKGAYTGAASRKHGLFEVADTGTIFLDEIAEISAAMQVKLLRVLETSTFRRVGGTANIRVDVRILAATNRDLYERVREGEFREDLYYRLNVISISIPPLRERREDIPLLARHFLKTDVREVRPSQGISKGAMAVLEEYGWPGNIRELQNVIERALILSENREIDPTDLPANIRAGDEFWKIPEGDHLPSLKEMEKNYLAELLKRFGGHRGKIARVVGVSERTLYRKIRRHRLGE